jgi:hypothetical protein
MSWDEVRVIRHNFGRDYTDVSLMPVGNLGEKCEIWQSSNDIGKLKLRSAKQERECRKVAS